jgi:hypothetical protein
MVLRGTLLIAGGKPPKRLEPVDYACHLAAQPLHGPSKGPRAALVPFARHRQADAMSAHVAPKPPTAGGLIAHQAPRAAFGPAAPGPCDRALRQPGHHQRGFMPLPRRQEPGEGLAVALGPPMAFGAAAALAAAEGVCVWAPFLAPAACWWARMLVRSTTWSSPLRRPAASAWGLRVSKSFAQTPARVQR